MTWTNTSASILERSLCYATNARTSDVMSHSPVPEGRSHKTRDKHTHTEVKPFQCDQCTYRCTQSAALTIHKCITLERSHYCTISAHTSAYRIVTWTNTNASILERILCCATNPHTILLLWVYTSAPTLEWSHSSVLERRKHKHTHTEEKPCDTSAYRCAQSGALTLERRATSQDTPGEHLFQNIFCWHHLSEFIYGVDGAPLSRCEGNPSRRRKSLI